MVPPQRAYSFLSVPVTRDIVVLERFAVENGNRSGARGSGRPRRTSLKTMLFRRNDGSAAFEIGQFQKQNALEAEPRRAPQALWDAILGMCASAPRSNPDYNR